MEYLQIINSLLTRSTFVFASPRFGFMLDNAMKVKMGIIQIVSKVLQRINVKCGDTIEE